MRSRPLLVIAAVLGIALALASPAGAHTEVQRATPSPGAVVTGPVDSVELLFLDPVLPTVSISVRATDGGPVDDIGAVTHTEDGRSASVTFAPITSAGDYVVDYEFVAADGDAQIDAYRFTVTAESGEDEASSVGVVLVVLVVVGLGLAVAIALRRRTREA